jgi:hypothetical protein
VDMRAGEAEGRPRGGRGGRGSGGAGHEGGAGVTIF